MSSFVYWVGGAGVRDAVAGRPGCDLANWKPGILANLRARAARGGLSDYQDFNRLGVAPEWSRGAQSRGGHGLPWPDAGRPSRRESREFSASVQPCA
jgi:hypothetical protein